MNPDSLIQSNLSRVTFGIQGGKASFNENALLDYVKRHKITDNSVQYLYTTERVLTELEHKNIDMGLFAIHNSVGGIVNESLHAISKHTFNIVEEFGIKIEHYLMKLPQIDVASIDTIISHDQVLKQCKDTLKNRYSYLKQTSGSGDLLDTASAAEAVAKGEINQNQFILGNKRIAEVYGFEIIDEDLQDDKENYTSFLMVESVK